MNTKATFNVAVLMVLGLGVSLVPVKADAQSRAADTVAAVPMISRGAVWKYLDNGTEPDAAWRNTAFDDSSWISGKAQLGYGDGDEATVVSFGSSPTNRHITTYFRGSFTVVQAAAFSGLKLGVLHDDGVVVYLNGVEVYRHNMPSGAINQRTKAASALAGAAETTFFQAAVQSSLLKEGVNVIAAEVHQWNATSMDMSFDLELFGQLAPPVTPPPASVYTTLVGTATVWKYLDNGSDQGAAWIFPAFDDSSWLSGKAQLGYGDGDEATVVSFGSNPTNRNITTYFRQIFNAANPASFANLVLRVLRDDGVAVYLNGTEIFRNNLAANASYKTRSSAAAAGADESKFYTAVVNSALLVEGANVVAAEVHQCNATSVDLSFDLELVGRVGPAADNVPAIVKLTSPVAQAGFTAPAEITLSADVIRGSGEIQWVEFFANGKLLGRDTTSPYSFTWKNASAGTYTLQAKATDSRRKQAVSSPVKITVLAPANQPPVVSIVQPANGAAFVAPANLVITAVASDADGTVSTVEFLAGNIRLGVASSASSLPVDPIKNVDGTMMPGARQFLFTWEHVPAGDYVLTAKASDNQGATTISAPVSVQVYAPRTQPVVNVAAVDALAIEGTTNTALFAITRSGDPSLPLTVYYKLTGPASNGVDYVTLPGQVEIAAQETTGLVEIKSLADDVTDEIERVTLTLKESLTGDYLVGASNSALIHIVELSALPPVPGGIVPQSQPTLVAAGLTDPIPAFSARLFEVTPLASGECQMIVIGESGQDVTIEVSENLEEWQPIVTLKLPDDGLAHFTDTTAGQFSRSFYRLHVDY